jgi:F-type H+-transporting ATPase subunit a
VTHLLAGANVVSHLTDYELLGPYFTAHHFLLIMSAAVTIGLFAFAAKAIRTSPKGTGMVSLLEVGLVWVRDEIVYPWLGEEQGRKYLFFFWTLFFFILVNNIIGLLPAPLNLWHRGATGNLAVTASLAIISFIVVNVIGGMREHGVLGYFKALIPGGVPGFLVPIVFPIELVGLITKPFALTVRLFANMTAGHAILAVLFGFMWGVSDYASAAIGTSVSVAAFAFMLFIFLFETLVALIQAYIFTVLTAIFLSMAVSHDH